MYIDLPRGGKVPAISPGIGISGGKHPAVAERTTPQVQVLSHTLVPPSLIALLGDAISPAFSRIGDDTFLF